MTSQPITVRPPLTKKYEMRNVSMKNFTTSVKNFFVGIGNQVPIVLSIIATIAIIGYLFISYGLLNNWWSLPVIAVSSGIISMLLAKLSKRCHPCYAVTEVGIFLLTMTTWNSIMAFNSFFELAICLYAISVFFDFALARVSLRSIIIDFLITFFAAWVIFPLDNGIITLISAFIAYLATFYLNKITDSFEE